MNKGLVSIVIINWNNRNYIERCVKSILSQSYQKIEIVFIDNDSSDGSYEYFCKMYEKRDFIKIKNRINKGYSGAANQGINISKGEYVMILNPDIILENDFIERTFELAEKDETIAAISGKLLKYDFENDKKLNIIDSTGIIMFKDRSFVDRGQNEVDYGKYEKIQRVFGVCGAAPFYRKSILKKISINNECFDEDFFAYKEDVDLSWRINLYGYQCVYLPTAIAYHGRGFDKVTKSLKEYIKNRNKKSIFIRKLSYRNDMLLQLKNETDQTKNKYRFSILKRRIKYYIYALVFEREILSARKEVKMLKNKMKEKNIIIQKNSKNSKNYMRSSRKIGYLEVK